MNWKTKVQIQRTLEKVPGGRAAYALCQQLNGSRGDSQLKSNVEQGIRLLQTFAKAGQSVGDLNGVEIGSGWALIVPVVFWLNGLRACHTYDLTNLLDAKLMQKAMAELAKLCADPASLKSHRPFTLRAERGARLRELIGSRASAAELLREFEISYHAPADAGATQHADGSMDLVFSNNVLEHVPAVQIRRIFDEARRILKPGGWMLHVIDPSDHFEHDDDSISPINFLTFSETEFARCNTSFCYQNRLRAPSYRQLIEDAGFEIVHWESRLNAAAAEQLPRLALHSDFARFSPEEICSMSLRIVARKP
ncbi:MAG: class I SAM-dependent methyltransferase [Verrucomicrobia bacterium]|nr:class I SAM-dependent methyltransferase [Verrucomicrobiota bacterium]